jgi:8-oxo-dGTP pyrophosphatase MutT (NUDIX family)
MSSSSSSSKDETKSAAASKSTPRVDSVTDVASTRWIALQTIHWTDETGKARQWDMATRTTKQKRTSAATTTDEENHESSVVADAVVIIPILRNANGVVETLLVEQYRPPLQQTTIEFPAGLVDHHKNETIQQAALRELREETGYVGEACTVPPLASRAVCMSPGLCDETVHVVLVEVDTSNPYNQNPKPELDDGEFITVQRIPLQQGIQKLLDHGTPMPIMGLYLFALGFELGATLNQEKIETIKDDE